MSQKRLEEFLTESNFVYDGSIYRKEYQQATIIVFANLRSTEIYSCFETVKTYHNDNIKLLQFLELIDKAFSI